MAEQHLRLDPALGHAAGPAPASLAEGLGTDGAPLILQHDPLLASLPPPPPAPGPEFDWGLAVAALHGALTDAVLLLPWFFLLCFFALNGGYLLLNLASLFMLKTRLREQGAAVVPGNAAQHETPVSIILPAGNDAAATVASVHVLLQLEYAESEIIIVNDDSRALVLQALTREFALVPFPEVYRERLPVRHVKALYASTVYPRLRLVDKESGDRADALNAALNCARYPLFCAMDADFILRRDSLRKMGQAFRHGPDVVAACAPAGIANDCSLHGDFMGSMGLPRSWLALVQTVEHMRSIKFALMPWSRLNAMLPTSRIFGMFHKETAIAAGGFGSGALNVEMELVARIHRRLRREGRRYHIANVPDPVCWMELPESLNALQMHVGNRQASLMQSLEMNRPMLFGRGSGAVGWLGFPFVLLFEGLAPWLEVLGYLSMGLLWLSGLISFQAFWAFLLAVIGLGALLSASALLLDEMTLRPERKLSHTLKLFAAALLENLGYRQLAAWWRVRGILRHAALARRANSAGALKLGSGLTSSS